MTRYLEEVDAYLSDPQKIWELMASLKNVNPDTPEAQRLFPGIDPASRVAMRSISQAMNYGQRYFAGRSWPDGNTAVQESWPVMIPKAVALNAYCMTAGVLCSRNAESLKNLNTAAVENLFNSEPLLAEGKVIADEISTDKELLERFSQEVQRIFDHWLMLTGFKERAGRETAHIWDAWRTTMATTSKVLYVVGYTIEKEGEERLAFEEIVSSIQPDNQGA